LAVLRVLLRVFSFLFHASLAVCLLAISGLVLSSGPLKLHFPMLPWTGDTLTFTLFFGSLFGLLALLLALGNKLPVLFFLYSLAVAVILLKGYVFSGYYFAHGEVRLAGGLLLASWIAMLGAWPRRRRRKY
jgi:hypothetical protein